VPYGYNERGDEARQPILKHWSANRGTADDSFFI
jgi:hypothetical protein